MVGASMTLVAKATKTPKHVPKMTKYKKAYYAKGGKKRKANYNTMNVNTVNPLVKPRLFTKMLWQEGYNIASGLSNSFTYIWRANSIYDPDYGSIARNASADGITLAGRIYQKYIVHGVLVEVDACQAVTNTNPVVFVLSATNANAGFSTSTYIESIAARDGSVSKTLMPSGADGSRVKFKKYYRICDILGVTKEQYRTDVNNMAAISANPTNTAYISTSIGNLPDGNGLNQTVIVHLKMTYFVEFSDIIESVTDS